MASDIMEELRDAQLIGGAAALASGSPELGSVLLISAALLQVSSIAGTIVSDFSHHGRIHEAHGVQR